MIDPTGIWQLRCYSACEWIAGYLRKPTQVG